MSKATVLESSTYWDSQQVTTFKCPKCKKTVHYGKFCGECGVEINWISKDEEKQQALKRSLWMRKLIGKKFYYSADTVELQLFELKQVYSRNGINYVALLANDKTSVEISKTKLRELAKGGVYELLY